MDTGSTWVPQRAGFSFCALRYFSVSWSMVLRLAVGVGEDFAVGEVLHAQVRGWVDLLGDLGGFDGLGVVGSSVGGVGLLRGAVLLLFGLNGTSGAAVGLLVGCGGLHRGRRGLGRHDVV